MENNLWQRFSKRIPIKADKKDIYSAWATRAGLERWFLRRADFFSAENKQKERDAFIEAGDSYQWFWFGYPDSVYEENKVLLANGNDFFQFLFTANCIVSINIKSEQGENLVELVQENIPEDDNPASNLFVACGQGWTFYLTNLKSILEGGIDLRNKNIQLSGVINS